MAGSGWEAVIASDFANGILHLMKDGRSSKLVAVGALLLLGSQVAGRPGVNAFSIRETKFSALDDLWTNSSRYLSRDQSEPDDTLVWVAAQCGLRPDLFKVIERVRRYDQVVPFAEATNALETLNEFTGPVLKRTADATYSVQSSAISIYRSDILSTLAENAPWWRVKSWQIGFSLGLWSGRLDEPSGYLTEQQIEAARSSSEIWYRRVTRQIVCDAARSQKLKEITN